jgi:ribosomal protein L7/L12
MTKESIQLGQLKQELQNGVSLEQIILDLAESGESIMASIKLVRLAANISLGEAKRIVSMHPAYKEVVEANQHIHDAAENSLFGH